MAASASITESVVSVRHQILVCLVVADVVSPPDYSSVFLWLQPLSKDGQRKSIESEARLLHASLSHVKLSLVAWRHQQWPKTAAPQKHSHAFHARLPQKCCSEIDTLFDVLLLAVNWEEHQWPFWSSAQSPKCSSLLNRSVADAKQSYEVSHSFFFSPALFPNSLSCCWFMSRLHRNKRWQLLQICWFNYLSAYSRYLGWPMWKLNFFPSSSLKHDQPPVL